MTEVMGLEVITPERLLFKEQVEALVMPGTDGRLGVLPRHAPMVVLLKPGVLTYRQQGNVERIAVSDGFCEVDEDRIVVLVDTAERAEDIDVMRAHRPKNEPCGDYAREKRQWITPGRAQRWNGPWPG